MMGCCQLTYKKYLNEDGTVDKDVLWEYIHDMRLSTNKREQELFLRLFYNGELKEENLCKCECHIKGLRVLH